MQHMLQRLPKHGDDSGGRSHRQLQRCGAGDWAASGRTVGGLLKGYRRSGSQDSPSEELYGIVVVTQFLDDEDELSLDVFLGCSLLTGKPLIFTKTKSFIND